VISSSQRPLYLTSHNTHNRETSMLPGGIRTQNVSRRAATETGIACCSYFYCKFADNVHFRARRSALPITNKLVPSNTVSNNTAWLRQVQFRLTTPNVRTSIWAIDVLSEETACYKNKFNGSYVYRHKHNYISYKRDVILTVHRP